MSLALRMSLAIILMATIMGLSACGSRGEIVTVRNNTGVDMNVAVVFSMRTGFYPPKGVAAGPGARCVRVPWGETVVINPNDAATLLPIYASRFETTIIARPAYGGERAEVFVVERYITPRRGTAPQNTGRREVRCVLGGVPGTLTLAAENEEAAPLYVRTLGEIEEQAAARIRGWIDAMPCVKDARPTQDEP